MADIKVGQTWRLTDTYEGVIEHVTSEEVRFVDGLWRDIKAVRGKREWTMIADVPKRQPKAGEVWRLTDEAKARASSPDMVLFFFQDYRDGELRYVTSLYADRPVLWSKCCNPTAWEPRDE